jgi:hypothetical protein
VRVVIFGLAILVLAACQPIPALPTAAPTDAQPAVAAGQSSPIATPTAEAAPVAAEQVGDQARERFQIDRPVKANDTVVKGGGPTGTAIVLYDLTRMGVELGATTIGEDGRFMIQVQPLTGNTRIGIQLAEQNDAIWADKSLLGPEAQALPLVGAFVDTVLVSP